MTRPLAERMRPSNPDEFVGQSHLMAPGAPLRKAIETGHLHSCILWGPPGVGKTSLAIMIAKYTDRQVYSLSAINAGVKDIREVISRASSPDIFLQKSPILFIDEIHRFNKSQQDALLEAVETGKVILIGATTENPSFEVNNALLSRCQVYILHELSKDELSQLVENAIKKDAILNKLLINVTESEALFYFSGGDARKLYNLLELLTTESIPGESIIINNTTVEKLMLSKSVAFDKKGEMHYDIISAFIKSIRGSDPDAAVYWMARMLEGGEDPVFICRRMVILAAEDIGLANNNALLLATACMDALHKIGMPEARIPMAQCAIYLALSDKSNSAYVAIDSALKAVRENGDLAIPFHLRNAPTRLMKEIGYGKDYLYPHDYPRHFVRQQYLPDHLISKVFYNSGLNAAEEKLRVQLMNRKTMESE